MRKNSSIKYKKSFQNPKKYMKKKKIEIKKKYKKNSNK